MGTFLNMTTAMATAGKKRGAKSTVVDADLAPVAEFRKANDSIALKVVEGNLSLLSRRVYNALVAEAQDLKVPGNVPSADLQDDPASQSYFWMPLQKVIKDTAYNSNDYDTLKQHADELQNIKVEMESTKMYTSERLLSGIKIFNSKGLRNRGGEVWLGFTFPPEVMQLVLKPSMYTRLSLLYQIQLRTASSLSLYEVCRRYATNPSHVTNREKWEAWYYVITGTPTSDTALPEYKYFKRDHLLKSIAEINAITDIEIELLEFKEGRRIAEIQFKVFEKAQATLELPSSPIINTALVARIVAFGIPREEAVNIYTSYDESVVLAHVNLVEARIKSPAAKPVESPAAYFKDAIAKGYANMPAVEVVVKPEAPKKKRDFRAEFEASRGKLALVEYEGLPETKRLELFNNFAESADKVLRPYLKKQLENMLVRSAFAAWLVKAWWGEPTADQILEFAESASTD